MHINEIRSQAIRGAHGFPTGRNWYGWCQASTGWMHVISKNGQEPQWYPSARAAWNASPEAVSKDPYAAPEGAIHWFTANHPDYDSKVSLGGGRVQHAYRDHSDPWNPLINIGEDEWANAAAKAPWMTSTYLGWTYGFGPGGMYTIDVQRDNPPPAGTVRLRNGKGTANLRALPDPTSEIVGEIGSEDFGDFNAITHGANVSGQDLWVRGAYTGPWAWLGSFTNQSDANALPIIPDPRPKPSDPLLRYANDILNIRPEPSTAKARVGQYASGDEVRLTGWTSGQNISGSDVWFRTDRGWVHAGGFDDASTAGVPRVEWKPTDPPIDPTPKPLPYTFEAFHPVVTDVIPTILGPSTQSGFKAEPGNFPARPEKIVIHDFGTLGIHTYRSVINDFSTNNGREVSSHFVIGVDEQGILHIVQMVALTDRAYHAAKNGNDFIGLEVDPQINTDTLNGRMLRQAVGELLAALNAHYGYEPIRIKHTDVPGAQTTCGDDIYLAWWTDDPAPFEPVPDPEPEPEPEPKPDPEINGKLDRIIELLSNIWTAIRSIFRV